MLDPTETVLEQWLLHEATECYNYYSCVEQETNHHVKAIWERFLDYELGHFQLACDTFKAVEKRDPAEIINTDIAMPLPFHSQREFVRKVLHNEVNLRTSGSTFVPRPRESAASLHYRTHINSDGSPSEAVSSGYFWAPGTEMTRKGTASGAAMHPGGIVSP
jgi:hypothetical protein